MAEEDANNNVAVRDDLVNTAAKFLGNPKVLSSPLRHKQEFLRRKGLTDEEIRRACELAAVNEPPPRSEVATSHGFGVPVPYRVTPLRRLLDTLNAAALIGATVYCLYRLYEKFIKPFLFGRKPPKDPIADLERAVRESVQQLQESVVRIENDLRKLGESRKESSVQQQMQEIRQDLTTLKSLQLSRKQFPSAPASIPPWQMETSNPPREKTSEREDDAGSGSSTNNSDSSLEMIREDPPKE